MYNGTYAPWEHYPKTLRHYEVENPMSVVVDFFSADSVKGHSRRLKEWRYYVVNDEHYDEKRHGPGTLLFIYDLNLRILEAMYLLLINYKNFSYGIYATQLDVVEELIIKRTVYNESYKGTLIKAFPKLFNRSNLSERVLLGNFTSPADIHKRPLAKFMQEIDLAIKAVLPSSSAEE